MAKLKGALKLNLIPLSSRVILIIIAIIGMPTPFAGAQSGVEGWGDGFNVLNFFAISSFGMGLCLRCWIMNCGKIGDL